MSPAEVLDAYGVEGARLRPLPATGDKRMYRVDRPGAAPLVLRLYAAERADDVASDAALLAFLERRGYPAERVVPSRDRRACVVGADHAALLTTFVAGAPTRFRPDDLRQLGEALGRLHALPLDSAPTRPARMLPRAEVAYAFSRLASAEAAWPDARRASVETALRELDLLEDLPDVLIHDDCHPGNSVRTPDGRVVLVDWEGAGRGPAVVDVGFLLVSCEVTAFGPNRLRPDRRRLEAVVDGYRAHHVLTSAELDRLPAAVRLRSLVAAAGSLARRAAGAGSGDEPPWWWTRYLAADEIAARARERLERAV